MAYSYFEGLVFFFLGILSLLAAVFNVVGVFLPIIFFIYALGGSVLRRVVPFLRFSVNDRCVSRNIANVYYLNFLIGAVFNKISLLSVL